MVETPSIMLPLGTPAPAFDLPDTEGGRIALDDFADASALLVVFLCNHCPFVKHVQKGLVDFARDYDARGLAIAAISSNDAEQYPADGPDAMAREKRESGYPFPYLYDESQAVAKAYKAACTPDFFLFDGDRRLFYRGQFDDSRPGNDKPVTGADLRAAFDAILAGKPAPGDQIPSIGCNIKWKPGNAPRY